MATQPALRLFTRWPLGMGGMRTSGDLVARMQMTRGMKIAEAKKYVADKLGVSVAELTDAAVMWETRQNLGIGVVYSKRGLHKGIEAKHHIAQVLDIEINSLNRFRQRIG